MNQTLDAKEAKPTEQRSGEKPSQQRIISDVLSEFKPSTRSIFVTKPASVWLKDASEKPPPKPLYLLVWHEGEVCILYADTNVGKSILAVMIADIISQHQAVGYIDFELTDKQFEARYSEEFKNHYRFSDNFFRSEINPDEADFESAGFGSLEDYIIYSIEQFIVTTGARVLIIDNITYLRSETEKAREALPLMKDLKALKNKYGLSILVLAHTPKRDASKPITKNDLQGSKMLINFCDSAFALGESSQDKSLRYLKQIKCRNAAITYDADNVLVMEVCKPANFLMFKHVHTAFEHEHLKQPTKADREAVVEQVKELCSKGLSQREIAKKLQISVGSVNNYINK